MNPLVEAARHELARPEWLWLLPLLVLLIILLERRCARGDAPDPMSPGARADTSFVHPCIDLLRAASAVAQPRRGLSVAWRWLVAGLLAFALAQPEQVGRQLPEPPRQRDIVFIVDTSVSMVLRDYILDGRRIDRMSLLKGITGRFVEGLRGDRLSIVVFGDQAHTLVPLTRDHRLLRRMLARIETGLAGRSNAVGEAVALAVREAGQADATDARRRVLVLFTDASLPTGGISPMEAAALATERKLRLYTIAIGASSAEAAEERTTGLIYHPADLTTLQAMAERTGGRAYRATDTAALTSAIEEIARTEDYAVEVAPRHIRRPLYQWPLAAALLILTMVQLRRMRRGPA